ncbi:MAG: hypothetical protein HFG20_11095 [Anaerotruncus sp.]|nr:hypothetical protein [Anaerotruncus sp.]
MKRTKVKHHSFGIGLFIALATFVGLSLFNSGLMEFSKDAGMIPWLLDEAVYAVAYKFGYKLVASVILGCFASFVSSMIAYGQMVKSKKVSRTTRVQFRQQNTRERHTA